MNIEDRDLTDIINYTQSVIKYMTRSVYMEVCVYNAHLYVIADNAIMYCIDLSGKLDPSILIGYHNTMDVFSNIIVDNSVIDKVLSKYKEFKDIELNNNKIYEREGLRDDSEFEKRILAKAPDGASFYFVHTNNGTVPFLPIFNGLPILNKGDNVNLELYEIGKYNILVRMIIYKKKLNNLYDLYYKLLDVNRPIRNTGKERLF